MKVRFKNHPEKIYDSNSFNVHGVSEVIVCGDDIGCDSVFIHELEVLIPYKGWMGMIQAFDSHNLITNNHNTCFFYPLNQRDKKRGYTLY